MMISLLFPVITMAAVPGSLALSLREVEDQAVHRSYQLKSMVSSASAAKEMADSQYARLFPHLTLDGSYQYQTHVPNVVFPAGLSLGGLSFGFHDAYAIGPTLTYTLWDGNSIRDAYHGADTAAQARSEDEKNGELQLLYGVRGAYVKLQLSLEELRLLKSSLALARAQNHDIETNYRAGAATRLDEVDSLREVLNYQLQLQQKLAEVGSNYRDLVALTQDSAAPAWEDVVNGEGETRIQLDSLGHTLGAEDKGFFPALTESQPSLKSFALQAESARQTADGQLSGLYPTVRLQASARWQYPDQILPNTVEQNTLLVSLSMPLFEFNQTRHLAAQAREQADSAEMMQAQTRVNLERDFIKAKLELGSLHAQQKLAVDDVAKSQDAANLYYRSYRGGKINLTDVEAANNRALNSKVSAARIDAQILLQIFALKAISGETLTYGR